MPWWVRSGAVHAQAGAVQKQCDRLRPQWMLLQPHVPRVRSQRGMRQAHERGVRAQEWAVHLPHEPMRLHRAEMRVQGSETRFQAMLMKMR